MEDLSKTRMNLAAIKKADPYAKEIVDSSAHVAFYTFNAERNEWEKTNVEGAFFIYNRSGQPYYSIFINNRLNTNTFVEPVTSQLEVQSQPPFLLYRNERSRIRGFWFYNSEECDRIANVVAMLAADIKVVFSQPNQIPASVPVAIPAPKPTPVKQPMPLAPLQELQELEQEQQQSPQHNNEGNVNIFRMLSKAQQDFNNIKTTTGQQPNIAPGNVLKFFESANKTAGENKATFRALPTTLSVEQLERQHRNKSPEKVSTATDTADFNQPTLQSPFVKTSPIDDNLTPFAKFLNPSCSNPSNLSPPPSSAPIPTASVPAAPLSLFDDPPSDPLVKEKYLKNLIVDDPLLSHLEAVTIHSQRPTAANHTYKPALMLPTMFEKPASCYSPPRREPLNRSQLVQAFNYLIHNDDDFVHKLHEAYLKTFTKTLVDTYQ